MKIASLFLIPAGSLLSFPLRQSRLRCGDVLGCQFQFAILARGEPVPDVLENRLNGRE